MPPSVAFTRRLDETDWTLKQREAAEQWLAWADDYLKRCDLTTLLFLNPMLKADDGLFSHCRYSPRYHERDGWMAL